MKKQKFVFGGEAVSKKKAETTQAVKQPEDLSQGTPKHKRAHPDESTAANLLVESDSRKYAALLESPEYKTEADAIAKLVTHWNTTNKTITNSEKELETASAETKKVKAKLDDWQKKYDAAVGAQSVIEKRLIGSKEELTRLELQFGLRWHNIRNLAAKTGGHWKKWLTTEAAKLVPGVTEETVTRHIKMYEDVIGTPVPEAFKGAMVEQGVKATKGVRQAVRSGWEDMRKEAQSDPKVKEIVELLQQHKKLEEMPDDKRKGVLSVMADWTTKKKQEVSQKRSQAGKQGGAGNRAEPESAHTPIIVEYTADDRTLMAYNAIAKQMKHIPPSPDNSRS